MRILPIGIGLLLATALISLAPFAEARADACVGPDACPGVACYDANGDRKFSNNECVVIDTCQFRSDCCPPTSFWCPETE